MQLNACPLNRGNTSELTLCETRKEELQRQLLALRSSPQKTDRLPTEKEIKAALNGFRSVLESGTQQERAALLEENIEEIVVEPTGDVLLKANPKGFFPGVFHCNGAEGRARTGTTDNGQRILSIKRCDFYKILHAKVLRRFSKFHN